jgi:di/tripeptidase
MISFGPDIKHAHTISEKVKIGTVDNFLNLLRAMIVEIPKALEQESD